VISSSGCARRSEMNDEKLIGWGIGAITFLAAMVLSVTAFVHGKLLYSIGFMQIAVLCELALIHIELRGKR
jgi:hypothetical protein